MWSNGARLASNKAYKNNQQLKKGKENKVGPLPALFNKASASKPPACQKKTKKTKTKKTSINMLITRALPPAIVAYLDRVPAATKQSIIVVKLA